MRAFIARGSILTPIVQGPCRAISFMRQGLTFTDRRCYLQVGQVNYQYKGPEKQGFIQIKTQRNQYESVFYHPLSKYQNIPLPKTQNKTQYMSHHNHHQFIQLQAFHIQTNKNKLFLITYLNQIPSQIPTTPSPHPMQQVYLSSSEKSKIENEKQIFVLLRLIHFVEKYYSYDRIDKSTYETEINKLLDKYKRFSQMIPNHNLDTFCKLYNIPNEEISWARLVLEKGMSTEDQQNKGGFLFVQATAAFIQVLDGMTPVVAESRNMLESLQTILNKLCSRLKSPQFNEKFKSFQMLLQNYVTSRSINQSMTQSQFQQIRLSVQGLYMMMTHLVNN